MYYLRRPGTVLRVVSYTIDPVFKITKGLGKTEFTGAIGSFYGNILETIGVNFTSVSPEKQILGNAGANGEYDGVFGELQKGRADVQVMPFTIDIDHQPTPFGPVQMSGALKILSFFEPKTKPITFFETYNTFSLTVWLAFFLSLLLLSLTLTALTYSRSRCFNFCTSLWICYSYIPQQGTFHPKSKRLRLVLFLLLFGTFFLDVFFSNSIATNMIATDTSGVIQSLEDLLENDRHPLFLIDDPSYLHFKNGENNIYADVWAAQRKPRADNLYIMSKIYSDGLALALKMLLNKDVFIAVEYINRIISSAICSQFLHGSTKGIVPVISSSSYIDMNLAPTYGRNLSQEMYLAMDDLFYRLLENGLIIKAYSELEKNPIPDIPAKDCSRMKVQSVSEEDGEDGSQATLTSIRTLFLLYLGSIGVAFGVYIIERIVHLIVTHFSSRVTYTNVKPFSPLKPRMDLAPVTLEEPRREGPTQSTN